MGPGEASEKWTDAQRRSRLEEDIGEHQSFAVTGAREVMVPLKESCKAGVRTEDSPEAMGIWVRWEVGEKDTEEGREPGSVVPWKPEA